MDDINMCDDIDMCDGWYWFVWYMIPCVVDDFDVGGWFC